MSDESIDYAPVSRLALVALGAGVAAAAALIGPVFYGLPLLGIVIAVVALLDIERSSGLKAGRLAALAGLALSVGFGSQAVASLGTSRWLAARRAEQATLVFTEAVCRDMTHEARLMCGMEGDQIMKRLEGCCGVAVPPPRAAASVVAGGIPETWKVRVAVGECDVEVLIRRALGMVGERAGEHWLVLDCTADRGAVTRRPGSGSP